MTNLTLEEQVQRLRQQQSIAARSRTRSLEHLGAALSRRLAELHPVTDVPEVPEEICEICETCGGLGFFRYDVGFDDPRFGKMFDCDNPDCKVAAQQREYRRTRLLMLAGLPAKYQAMTFGTFSALSQAEKEGKQLAAVSMWMMAESVSNNYAFSMRQVASAMRAEAGQYSDVFKNWVVLEGDYGVGKTGLVGAFANKLAESGIAATFYRLDDLFREVQSRYDFDPDDPESRALGTAESVLSLMQKAEVLILDDFNTNHITNDRRTIVETLIRTRYNAHRATVITTNLSQDEFSQKWTERTATVVRDCAHWIYVTGAKLRPDDAPIVSF